jgi:DNA-binding NarL/FixJ family response regulator
VLARQHRPDLIVLDLAMPGRNGLDAIAELLAASPSTEVAVCSGFVSSGLAASARAEGASACFDKSLSPERLIEQLDALL